jgi:hypothetical protein
MELAIGDRVRERSESPAFIGVGGTVVGTIPGTGMAAVAVRRDRDGALSIHYIVNGVEPDLIKEPHP